MTCFSFGRLLSHKGDKEFRPKGGGKFGASTDQLKRLIDFFLESEVRTATAVSLLNPVLHVKSIVFLLLKAISVGELLNMWCLKCFYSLG